MSNQTKAQGYEGLILRGIVVLVILGVAAFACNWTLNALAEFGPPPNGVVDGNLTPCFENNCLSTEETDSEQYIAPIPLTIEVEDAVQILDKVIKRLPSAEIREQNPNYFYARIGSVFGGKPSDLEVFINTAANEIQIKLAPRASGIDITWVYEQVERLRSSYEQELE